MAVYTGSSISSELKLLFLGRMPNANCHLIIMELVRVALPCPSAIRVWTLQIFARVVREVWFYCIFLSGGATEDLPINKADTLDNEEYSGDVANQLCAEAWTWTNGRVKSQIDYVWSTSGIRFHGGVRDKLSGDHRPLTYDLEMERYGDGKYGCLRAPSAL